MSQTLSKLKTYLSRTLPVVGCHPRIMRQDRDELWVDEFGIAFTTSIDASGAESVRVFRRLHNLDLVSEQQSLVDTELFASRYDGRDDAVLVEATRAALVAIAEFRIDVSLELACA